MKNEAKTFYSNHLELLSSSLLSLVSNRQHHNMGSKWTVFMLLAIFCLAKVIFAMRSDLKDLHEELFTTRAYNRDISPHTTIGEPITMHVAFFLQGINYLDEVEEKLATTAHLRLEWKDIFLAWNKKDFGNISYFYVTQDKVWRPDIALHNGFTKLKELGDRVILVKVTNDGSIKWNPLEVFETKCNIDITKFPFDSQHCTIEFAMWAHKIEDIKLELKESALHTEEYERNGVWDLTESSIVLANGKFIIHLVLDRKSEYYLLTTICPIVLLSLLDIFTFVIPTNSGEKIGYSMTVHLSFAVLLTIVSSSLPINSRTSSYLSVYVISLLIKGTVIVMVTVAQVRLHHRPENMELSSFFRCVVNISQRMSSCSRRKVKPQEGGEVKECSLLNEKFKKRDEKQISESPRIRSDARLENGQTDMYTWPNVSTALDILFFCFFSATDTILVVVFFAVLM